MTSRLFLRLICITVVGHHQLICAELQDRQQLPEPPANSHGALVVRCVSPCKWPVNICIQQLSNKLSKLFTGTEGVTSAHKGPMGFGESGGVAV